MTRREILAAIRVRSSDQGLTQSRLAALGGMRQPDVARLLTGDHNVTLDTVLRLCDAVGLTLVAKPARVTVVE